MYYSQRPIYFLAHATSKPIWPVFPSPFPLIANWLFAKGKEEPEKVNRFLQEEAYLAHLKETDEEKFMEYLFRTYYAPLCKSVYNVVHDTDAAEDIVQDVFIKVWRRRSYLDLSKSVRSYLFRSCMNTALNYLEKYKKNTSIEHENLGAAVFSSHQTEEELDYQELNTRIQEAISTLPPKCRTVFAMSRYEQMSYAAIAKTLGVSVKAVEKHMGKALKIMRNYLKTYTDYPL